MNPKKHLLALATFGTITILALLMLHLTGLIPAVGTWYSYDPALRLQTDAFLRGELAIQPVPYGHLHDWAWGNGMQQVWGLGVPILQLPFQVFGKLVNGFGFPDRLIFLFFYVGVAILFWRSLETGSQTLAAGDRLKWRLLTLPILLYTFLNHALINMMQGKFEPYEEVISYGFLWSLMLFALLTIFLYKRGHYLYLLICFLAGFALNLRPTIGAYGGMTLVLAFLLAWKHKVRFRLTGLALFLVGIAFFLLMNDLRFGSPLESGHNLGLSNGPACNYVVKFDNPMTWIPFLSAAPELLSGLFFLDLHKFYELNDWLLWKCAAPRIREINFKPFYPVELILLVLAWSLAVIIGFRYRQKRPASLEGEEQLATLGLIWSFCSFALLFFFYNSWPGLISRYLVDFSPAIIISIASLYRYLLTRRLALPVKLLFAGVLLVLTIVTLAISETVSIYGDPVTVAKLDPAREKLIASRKTSGPPLPAEYRCGDKETLYEIPYNNNGWNISSDCAPSWVSTHFLERPECLEISLAPQGNAPDWMRKEYSDQEIEIKIGIETLQRVSEAPKGAGKVITFCRQEKRQSANHPPIEMISIKWLNLREHPGFAVTPIALLSLKKVK
ncbi:MAG: hypothetical protein HGA96_01810 [Desulfobulbaceae bacterium]|nr:hypothetical protein [Desulfobulbaceae bacterium]